ncbi:hypothetical protein QR680_011932 [Steinernema hermaphroditum]|uniref:Uncharacterized protein n=1 Tax=Steinernema hermaphroditum TaxID=289476 RepID=A0AA39I2R2_9BILA|nr:hypothetical protein QR680_011932 [Steinernema hermaphroditum]
MSGRDSNPLGALWSAASNIGRSISDAVVDASQAAGQKVTETASSISGTASDIGSKAKDSATSLAIKAKEVAGGVAETAVASSTKEGAAKAYTTTAEATSKLATEAKTTAYTTEENVMEFASEVVEDVTVMGWKAYDGAADVFGCMKKGITNFFGGAEDQSKDDKKEGEKKDSDE